MGEAKKISGHVEILENECKGCGLCVVACPVDVLKLASHLNRQGYHPAVYLGEGCSGCGICFYACPEPGAIAVYRMKVSPGSPERANQATSLARA